MQSGWERGRPVWGNKVEIPAAGSVRVSASFSQPAYPGQQLAVVPQPMVQDSEVVVRDRRDCAAG